MTDSFFHYLSFEKRYSKHTIDAYRLDLSQFYGYLDGVYGELGVSEIKHLHIRSWMVNLVGDNVQPRSINRKLSTLRSYFSFLKKKGEITLNPTLKILPPKSGKKLPSIIQEKNLDALLKSDFDPTFKGFRNSLIVEFLYSLGLRRSEIINLSYSDIDQSNSTVKVMGKGNKERVLPLSPSLLDKINEYFAVRNDQFSEIEVDDELFLTSKGKKMYPKLVYNVCLLYTSPSPRDS